jgi:hypothetical protein
LFPQDLLTRVQQFQAKVHQEAGADTLNLNRLEKLMEYDLSFDVDVPEVTILRQVLKIVELRCWFQRTQHVRQLFSAPNPESLCQSSM